MFERRQRAVEALHFTQSTRTLQRNEALPALPGLAAQLMACQSEMARRQQLDTSDTNDELDLGLANEIDDDFED